MFVYYATNYEPLFSKLNFNISIENKVPPKES